MKLQHNTHYLTRSLDVRYVVADKVSQNFWSKHSLYNPNNIDNTQEVSPEGESCNPYDDSLDVIPDSALCTQRNDEHFILLQNFEFINYYGDYLIRTAKHISDDFAFLSDKITKQGCIKVRVKKIADHTQEFPILALTTTKSASRIKYKLENLTRCLQ